MNAVSLTKPQYIRALETAHRDYRAAITAGDVAGAEWLAGSIERRTAGAREIDYLRRVAAAYGWREEFVRRYTNADPAENLILRRGTREELRMNVGCTLSSVSGQVATGPVSLRRIECQHGSFSVDIESLLVCQPADAYPPTEWVLVVGPGYVEKRDYETACNYAEYRVQPGVYPVELVDSKGRGNPKSGVDGRQPYWATVCAPSVRFHDYYVNRLGSASSLRESWEESPATTHMRIYSFQLENNDRPRELPKDITGKAIYMRRADVPDRMWLWHNAWAVAHGTLVPVG